MISQTYRQILNQRKLQYIFLYLTDLKLFVCSRHFWVNAIHDMFIYFKNTFKIDIEIKILSFWTNIVNLSSKCISNSTTSYFVLFFLCHYFNPSHHFLLLGLSIELAESSCFLFLFSCKSRSHWAAGEVLSEYTTGLYFPILNCTILSCAGQQLLHNRSSIA